ncbi:MAG: hypothetical protein PHD43_13760 [Methylococcales bacterium]|nr:hypothetical protein [Methylococcales bacterium]
MTFRYDITFEATVSFAMPLFIVLSLVLCFIVQTASSLQSVLVSPLFIYTGLILAFISIAGIIFKKMPAIIWYDIFAGSTLIVWFAYWKPLFNDDSPIFFFYPLYFALMTALVSLFVIGQQYKIDGESFNIMRSLSNKSIIQPWIIMLCVLASLELQQHFLLYPIMMTLLITRFALSSCLETRSH